MPLAFPSRSHGTIAFGYFNIETDLLLLEELFFFTDGFCQAVIALAEGPERREVDALAGWRITDPAERGHLHGAIAGVDLSGFIGATYRVFPFPDAPEDFRQSPEGEQNRAQIEELIASYGVPEAIPIARTEGGGAIAVGEYSFDEPAFAHLVAYVSRGGYPLWRDGVQPPVVQEMVQRLARLASPLLAAGGQPHVARPDDQ